MKPSAARDAARYSPVACAASHSGAVVMWRIRRVMTLASRGVLRPADVHVAPRLRTLDEAGVELVDLEAGVADERPDVACEMATSREPLLPGVEAMLEARDLRVGRQPVFGEVELGAGLEHPAQLTQRAWRVGNRAQRHRRERAVEPVVGEVEAGAVEAALVHGHARRRDPLARQLHADHRRVDRPDARDLGRDVRQVEPRTEPQFDHVAAQSGARRPAHDATEALGAQHHVDGAREHLVLVDAHARMLRAAGARLPGTPRRRPRETARSSYALIAADGTARGPVPRLFVAVTRHV